MKLKFLMEYSASLRPGPEAIGTGPLGTRRIVSVLGGSFEGPRLKGKLLPTGGDWLLVDSEGVVRLDVRATFETDDGALIYLQYTGIGRPDATRPTRAAGEPAEYGDSYFMTTPRFETGDERYKWLNNLVCVGEGKRVPEGVAYRFYAAVND